VHEELSPLGFTVITVALDRSPDEARRWIERAAPTHPSLVDTRWVLADLYNIVNVPTVLWIDEEGRIVRPNDVAYATDTYRGMTGIDSAQCIDAVRAWVRDGVSTIDPSEAAELQPVPTEEHQLARAEFGLGQWLAAHGRSDAAERHFVRAGELAPHDFTIRRGSMPMRGIDPRGPAFVEMVRDWMMAGNSYYVKLPK
jgi:hypothetical protein